MGLEPSCLLALKDEVPSLLKSKEAKLVSDNVLTFEELLSKDKKSLSLTLLKSENKILKKDLSASIIDLGDDILNVEFHSILQPTLNPIDGSYVEMINEAMDLIESNQFRALVSGNEGPNFSAGANLNLLLELSQQE